MAATLSSLFSFSTHSQLIFTALVSLMLLLRVTVGSNQSTSEVQTLWRFKQLTAAGSGVLTDGYWNTWNQTDNNPCGWAGVTCTTSSTVEQLILLDWKLKKLPSLGVLSPLKDLRVLDLSYNNNINSSIPDDIGLLVGLTHLNLSYSGLTGSIPQNMSACRRLQYISLEMNSLTGEIPDLSDLANLRYLILRNNQLYGPFPKWLGNLNSPLYIDLSNNRLYGSIPSLSNLPNLLELLLSNNAFTAFEGAMFPGATNLEHLDVSSNQLEGPIPLSITKLLNLKVLDMSYNRLSGDIPSDFRLNMSNAIWIQLSNNQLTGKIPKSLLQPSPHGLTNLPGLQMSNNLLSGEIPFDADKVYNYFTIDFRNNSLSGSIPSICNNGNSSIINLWLQNNNLSGDVVDFLGSCYHYIESLNLSSNSFRGDLTRLPKMSHSNLATPTVVDLSHNFLQMSSTNVTSDPFRDVLEFFVLNSSTEYFFIQGNNFSGTSLPTSLPFPAKFLQSLDLSSNELAGEIQAAAFNVTQFPVLQVLNLSNNTLTGTIPQAAVMNLTVLDVANNMLVGSLPVLPYTLYNPGFFEGNKLCGRPLGPCRTGVSRWVFLTVVGGSMMVIAGSFFIVIWRWCVYRKQHQHDADLIKTLSERQSASLMSLSELKKATNNFDASAQVGEGGFGAVYKGILHDGTMVAIKKIKGEGTQNDKDRFLNEVRILCQINHRHLVKLMGCCMENKVALLVFELVSNGTLQQHLRGEIRGIRLSWEQRLRIAVQTADALYYLHSAASFPIYHRDVKSANVLLDKDLNAKVADFGLSKLAALEATHVSTIVQGTVGYMDPEYYTSYQLTERSDVYSFGVVLLELISAKPAVDQARGGEKTGLVNLATIHIQNGDPEQLVDVFLLETYNNLAGRDSMSNLLGLAMQCLYPKAKARPSMYEVCKKLQKMWLEFQGIPVDSASVITDDQESLRDHIILLSEPISSNNSTFSLQSDTNSIELAQIAFPVQVK